ASENHRNQHSRTDTFANTSVPYTARVTRINAAAVASLAFAPAAPGVQFTFTSGRNKGMRLPMVARGKNEFDLVVNWEPPAAPDIAGYSLMIRPTTAPVWEREIYVGNVNT